MIRYVAPISALLLCGSALAAESYLCISDQATGFALNKTTGNWESTSFSNRSKYLISRSALNAITFEVKEVGETAPSALCKNEFVYETGALVCEDGIFLKFWFNRKTGRFLSVSQLGYWMPTPQEFGGEGAVTPYMEIGKCSPL